MSASNSTIDDWRDLWRAKIPLLVNLQPAGEYLGEDYHHAGGVPAVVQPVDAPGPDRGEGAMTVNGKTHRARTARMPKSPTSEVIRPIDRPLRESMPASACCAATCSTRRS